MATPPNFANSLIAKRLNGIFTYNEYLDSYVRDEDVSMLEDEVAARKLAELNLTTAKKVMSRNEFIQGRINIDESFLQICSLYSRGRITQGTDYQIEGVLMKELLMREESNRLNRIYSIIYIQDVDPRCHEISGYIDFADRLTQEDWNIYYKGKKKLRPRFTSDLSYYNYRTKKGFFHNSLNFYLTKENDGLGLRFVCRRDKHPVYADTNVDDPGLYTYMWYIDDPDYKKVIIYDHYFRI